MYAHPLTSRLALLVAGAALTAACGGGEAEESGPQTFDFKLDVLVEDTNKKPIVKAPVLVDGKTVGYTDKDGRFLATLKEEQGKELELRVAPPEGFALISDPAVKTKLKVRQDSSGAIVGETVSLQTTFIPALHEHLVWVALECGADLPPGACADIPIKNDTDEIVATTDPFGRAHFLINGMPGKSITLTLDTRRPAAEGSAPYVLDPVEPTFALEFDKDPEVFMIKQTLTNRAAEAIAAPVEKKTVKTTPSKPKPIRKPSVDKPKPKPKPEKKKDPNKREVIDLF